TSPLMRAMTLGVGMALHGDAGHYRREFERVFQVKPDDVTRVAREYLKPEKLVLVIEPSKSGKKESPGIEAGPIAGEEKSDAVAPREPEGGPDWSKLPGASAPRPFHAPQITRRKLASGLDVWIVPWHTLPIVDAHLIVRGGTADDPKGK